MSSMTVSVPPPALLPGEVVSVDRCPGPLTVEQAAKLADPNLQWELVEGKLIEMNLTNFEHGRIMARLGAILHVYVTEHGLGAVMTGDVGFVLAKDPDTARGPDVAFVRSERLPRGPVVYFDGPPDFAVEIVSPGETVKRVEEKAASWIDAGTRLLWVVWPQPKYVTVYQPVSAEPVVRQRGDTLDGSEVLPGFAVAVEDVFA